jgi:predicted lipoprotein with Yx(FWY)xxD motif
VVPDKRTISVAGGLLVAAALALAACAPKGYENTDASAGNNAGAAPALAGATGGPEASAAPEESASGAADSTGSNQNVDFTTELNSKNVAKMGNVVEDENGRVLYRFDKDKVNGTPTCVDKCAVIWPPALTDGDPTLSGVSADLVGTVTRADGTKQITIGGWPAYRYLGDEEKKAGSWSGQGVGGTWWVMDKTGKKNLTCVPTGTPTPVAPPADKDDEQSGATDDASSPSSGYGY